MFLPVPILHLGMVRHAWSSHLAQRCYIVNQLAALRFKPTTCIFRVPHAIQLAATSPTQYTYMCTIFKTLALQSGIVQHNVTLLPNTYTHISGLALATLCVVHRLVVLFSM